MSDWRRSTAECSFGDLTPAVLASIRAYTEKHELGDVGAEATFSAVTSSVRKKLVGKRSQTMSIVVTPELLVWSLSEGGEVVTIAARRAEIEVKEFHSDLVEDTGLDVFGFVPIGASERGTAFIGLGPDPASRRLEEALGLSP